MAFATTWHGAMARATVTTRSIATTGATQRPRLLQHPSEPREAKAVHRLTGPICRCVWAAGRERRAAQARNLQAKLHLHLHLCTPRTGTHRDRRIGTYWKTDSEPMEPFPASLWSTSCLLRRALGACRPGNAQLHRAEATSHKLFRRCKVLSLALGAAWRGYEGVAQRQPWGLAKGGHVGVLSAVAIEYCTLRGGATASASHRVAFNGSTQKKNRRCRIPHWEMRFL